LTPAPGDCAGYGPDAERCSVPDQFPADLVEPGFALQVLTQRSGMWPGKAGGKRAFRCRFLLSATPASRLLYSRLRCRGERRFAYASTVHAQANSLSTSTPIMPVLASAVNSSRAQVHEESFACIVGAMTYRNWLVC